MNIYDINGNIRCVVQKFSYNDTFMGETFLTMDIESPNAIPFEIGDNCSYRGDIFTLNYVPSVEKTASANSRGDAFKYASVKMNSVADELTRCRMLDIVPDDMNVVWTGLPEFSFYAQTVNDLARRLQANLDSLYKDDKKWTVTTNIANLVDYNGVLCSISGKNPIDSVMSISDKSCMEILAECWNTFRVTYIIRGRTITIAPTPIEVGATFGYGKGNGLYGLQQQTKQDAQIITRLYVYGSTRNIGNHYYANLTGKGKGTIDSTVSSLETERLSFDAATGIIHDGTVNLTLGGVTHNIPMTTSLNVANAVRDHIYDLRATEFPSWTLTKGDANSVVRVDFSLVGKYIYVKEGSSITIKFQGQTLYIQFAHEFSFSVSSFVSLISNRFVDANDSGGDAPQNWSVVNYVDGDTHLDFKCNTAGPRRNAEIRLNNITGLGVTLTLKEKGALYLDFKANSGGGRLETPTINANGTGLVASVFTSTYGLYPYGTGSNLYYFTLDFAYGTKYYKESTTQNGVTQYIVKFKAGDIEVNGYIELDDTHVVGIVYQSEPNSAAFYSAMQSATYIYITSGLYLDLLSSEYVSYNETISGNLAVNRLMLPDFPLVHNSPNDVYLDSPNIAKYGIRQGYVIFDGSDASKPEIYPTIHQMTAKNVIDSGITLSLDSAEGTDMSKIRLDKIKGVIMPTDGTKDGNIPTSVDYNYNSWQTTFTIFLKDLGFDLSQGEGKYYYATSDNMSISMISGTCAGREFKIDSIKRNTDLGYLRYELVCERSQDTNINKVYPYDSYPVSAGDEFVILNCRLPKVYVDANAQKLKDYGQAYLAKNDKTKYTYSPKVDEIWMDKHPEIANSIKAGDIFDFSDADLDLNVKSFIHTLSIKVGDKILPSYDITLDEEVESTTIQKIQNQINNISLATDTSTNITDVQQAIATYGNDYFVSKNNDDTVSGNISFKQDISVRGKSVLQSTSVYDLKVGNLSVGKIPCNTTNGLVDSPLYTDSTSVTSTVNIKATTFIGELQGNAATATKLQTARTIWGQNFDGTGNVDGLFRNIINVGDNITFKSLVFPTSPYGIIGRSYRTGSYSFQSQRENDDNETLPLCLNPNGGNVGIGTTAPQHKLDVSGNGYFTSDLTVNGNVGIGTTTPKYKLDVNGNARISNLLSAANGGIFYGQSTFPTNVGTYVLNFVSPVYGARVYASDGAAYKDLKLGAMPTSGVFGLSLNANGDTRVGYNIGTSNFVSRTTGWNVSTNGAADFRNIYADELRVQAFTADISQALAGSDYLTKSVSKLSANFVVPAVNSTVRIIVDDIEGRPATQCFSNNDYIRFRAFNRTSGLTIANVWGTVVLDTTFGTNGFSNGTQAYTFTCTQTTGAGLTVFKGSEVLDYGISGSGLIARTTLDSMGSPYEQIATWKNDPSNGNNYTVHARLGNLNGIANCNGYGLYTDNGFFTGKIVIGDLTKTANYLSFDTVNGLQIKLGGTSVATTTDVNNSLTTANTYTNTQISATNNSITAAVNGIQIGGRNLLTNTKTFSNYVNLVSWTKENDLYNGCTVYSRNGMWQGLYRGNDLYKAGTYTFSFWIKGTSDIGRVQYYDINDVGPVNGSVLSVTTDWKRVSITFTITSPKILKSRIEKADTNGTVYICGYKLEEGNKATSWSPAPEDIDANIATAQSTAISTAATSAAALYVTQTAYSSQVTILQDSINAKVSQTDFNALGTRVGTAESTITQHSTDIASKVSQTDYNGNTIASLINQTATTIQIQANRINLVGAVTIGAIDKSSVTPAALGAATPTDVSTAVNGIQIGGVNLFDNTNKGIVGWDKTMLNGSSNIEEDNYFGVKGVSYTVSEISTSWNVFLFCINRNNIENNTQYTLSLDVISDYDTTLNFNFINSDSTNILCSFGSTTILSNVAKHVELTGTTNNNENTGQVLYITGVNKVGNIKIANLQLNKGNKANASWIPSKLDLTNAINAAQSTADAAGLAASNAQTSANTANSAISDMTSDDKITALEKQAMKTEWDSIVSEKTKNDTQADNFGVSRTTYDSAYSTLSTTIGTNLSILTTTWDLGSGGGATLRSKFKAYYDARTDLLNAISTKAKTLANGAQSAVDNIQVGGRNLIIYSRLISGFIGFSGGVSSDSNNMCDPNFYACSGNQSFAASVHSNPTPKGGSVYIVFYDSNKNFLDYVKPFSDGNVYTPIFTSPSSARYYRYAICYKENICKIEFGNKTTDWTPAPEDVSQDAQNKVDELSRAHGGLTYLDAHSIYTGTLTANQVNAVGINAGSITVGTLNTDRIDANSVSTKIANVISLDAGRIKTGILSADRIDVANVVTKGIAAQTIDAKSATISNLNVVNANVSGTLNGVSGTFNYLQGVGSNGKFWFDNTFEALSIKDEDFRHLGRKNTRMVRFYASNIRCIGSFGASSLNMARVHDTYIDYFVNGDTYSYARSNLKPNGVGGYYVSLYPTVDLEYSLFVGGASLGDIVDFPVDLLVFDNSAGYHYEMLRGAVGKKVTVVNANDRQNNVFLAINGNLSWLLNGGAVQQFVNIMELTNPLISTSVHGAGWLMLSDYDNNW